MNLNDASNIFRQVQDAINRVNNIAKEIRDQKRNLAGKNTADQDNRYKNLALSSKQS